MLKCNLYRYIQLQYNARNVCPLSFSFFSFFQLFSYKLSQDYNKDREVENG